MIDKMKWSSTIYYIVSYNKWYLTYKKIRIWSGQGAANKVLTSLIEWYDHYRT